MTEEPQTPQRPPLPIVLFLITQTIAGIWWASGVTHKIDGLDDAISNARINPYTSVDAARDLDVVRRALERLERRMDRMEDRGLRRENDKGIESYKGQVSRSEEDKGPSFYVKGSEL